MYPSTSCRDQNERKNKKSKKGSNWKREFEGLLIKHASEIASIQTTVRSLTYLLPGRFKYSEILSEGSKLQKKKE